MEVRKTRTCEKCSVQIPIDKVRLFPRDGERNWLVCESCCERLKTNTSSRVMNRLPQKDAIKNVAKPIASPPAQKKTDDPAYKTKFCTRCKYYFKVDDNRAGVFFNIVCPYCGKNDRLGIR